MAQDDDDKHYGVLPLFEATAEMNEAMANLREKLGQYAESFSDEDKKLALNNLLNEISSYLPPAANLTTKAKQQTTQDTTSKDQQTLLRETQKAINEFKKTVGDLPTGETKVKLNNLSTELSSSLNPVVRGFAATPSEYATLPLIPQEKIIEAINEKLASINKMLGQSNESVDPTEQASKGVYGRIPAPSAIKRDPEEETIDTNITQLIHELENDIDSLADASEKNKFQTQLEVIKKSLQPKVGTYASTPEPQQFTITPTPQPQQFAIEEPSKRQRATLNNSDQPTKPTSAYDKLPEEIDQDVTYGQFPEGMNRNAAYGQFPEGANRDAAYGQLPEGYNKDDELSEADLDKRIEEDNQSNAEDPADLEKLQKAAIDLDELIKEVDSLDESEQNKKNIYAKIPDELFLSSDDHRQLQLINGDLLSFKAALEHYIDVISDTEKKSALNDLLTIINEQFVEFKNLRENIGETKIKNQDKLITQIDDVIDNFTITLQNDIDQLSDEVKMKSNLNKLLEKINVSVEKSMSFSTLSDLTGKIPNFEDNPAATKQAKPTFFQRIINAIKTIADFFTRKKPAAIATSSAANEKSSSFDKQAANERENSTSTVHKTLANPLYDPAPRKDVTATKEGSTFAAKSTFSSNNKQAQSAEVGPRFITTRTAPPLPQDSVTMQRNSSESTDPNQKETPPRSSKR